MARFNLSASSPDAWQALSLQYQDRFTNADVGNRDNAQRVAAANIDNFRRAQLDDEAARDRDQKTRLGLWQFWINRADQQNLQAESRRRFDTGVALDRESIAADKEERKRIEALNLADITAQRTQLGTAKAIDFFATPKRRGSVDLKALSVATGVPEKNLVPLEEKADEALAIEQTEKLNAGFLKAVSAMQSALVTANPAAPAMVPATQIAQLRHVLEAQLGEKHPLVKFDEKEQVWKVEKQRYHPPFQPVTNDRYSVGTPAFFAPPTATAIASPAMSRPVPTPLPRGGGTMMDFSEHRIGTQAEYEALPSPSRFIWTYPDGRQRTGRKP